MRILHVFGGFLKGKVLHLVAFLAEAVQNCGSASSVAGCVRGKIMAFPPITPPAAPTIPAIPTP